MLSVDYPRKWKKISNLYLILCLWEPIPDLRLNLPGGFFHTLTAPQNFNQWDLFVSEDFNSVVEDLNRKLLVTEVFYQLHF